MIIAEMNNVELFKRRAIDQGLISQDGCERASRAAQSSNAPLHFAIEQLGLAKDGDILEVLATALNLSILSRNDFPDAPYLEGSFSTNFMKTKLVVPIKQDGNCSLFAVANPFDQQTIDAVAFHLSRPVNIALASRRDIEWIINERYEGSDNTVADVFFSEDDVEKLRSLATEQPIIRYVNRLIDEAVDQKASDIHLEPEDHGLRIRLRVDGVLIELDPPASSMTAAILSRVKIMAKLDIAERRLPQDGRIRTTIRGMDIDLRVSTTPTLHGESIVMRLLDKNQIVLEFEGLGFSDEELERFKSLLQQPNGIVLVTGPTGSGKTTTLYTSLKYLNDGKRKIFSVEDPVEYQLSGVNQIPIHPQIDLTFARALRSILRQDPDIIMIGEIRDLETAEIAIQAALTGHLVLATLHTNNAASTMTRLLDMGLDDYLLGSAVNGIAGQRLVRKLCCECAIEDKDALPMLQKFLYKDSGFTNALYPMKAVGCNACGQSGYKGRTTIIEVLTCGPAIKQAIMENANDHDIELIAQREGMRTMREAGANLVARGITTFDEVLRVTRSL